MRHIYMYVGYMGTLWALLSFLQKPKTALKKSIKSKTDRRKTEGANTHPHKRRCTNTDVLDA